MATTPSRPHCHSQSITMAKTPPNLPHHHGHHIAALHPQKLQLPPHSPPHPHPWIRVPGGDSALTPTPRG